MWETPLEGLRVGGSAQFLQIRADLQGLSGTAYTGHLELPAVLHAHATRVQHGPTIVAGVSTASHSPS